MPPDNLQEPLKPEDAFNSREVLQSLGIAILLVSAVFVLVSLLLMPFVPV